MNWLSGYALAKGAEKHAIMNHWMVINITIKPHFRFLSLT